MTTWINTHRIDIFNSTLSLLRQGWYITQDGRKVNLPAVGDVMAALMYREEVSLLIDFAILDGYRTCLHHNPEGNLKPSHRDFGVL